MSPPTVFEEFTETLVSLGEAEVRSKLLQRVWNSPRKEWAAEWLEFEEKKRASATAARAETREEETLSIAKNALSIASEANRIATEAREAASEQARWAMWAAIIAAVAAVIATKDQILALIFGQP